MTKRHMDYQICALCGAMVSKYLQRCTEFHGPSRLDGVNQKEIEIAFGENVDEK